MEELRQQRAVFTQAEFNTVNYAIILLTDLVNNINEVSPFGEIFKYSR